MKRLGLTRTQSFAGGDYLLNFLVPGKYKLEAEKEGFQKVVVVEAGVMVNAGGIGSISACMWAGCFRPSR